MSVKQVFVQMCAVEVEAKSLLTAIEDLRALFPDGELPPYLCYVEEAIEQVEPALREIARARPY